MTNQGWTVRATKKLVHFTVRGQRRVSWPARQYLYALAYTYRRPHTNPHGHVKTLALLTRQISRAAQPGPAGPKAQCAALAVARTCALVASSHCHVRWHLWHVW